MLERLLLFERFDDETLFLTWKFPSSSSNESLLLNRLLFIWREKQNKVKYFRFNNIWQCIEFGKGFAFVMEISHHPTHHDFYFLAQISILYEKGGQIEQVVAKYLEYEEISSEYTDQLLTISEDTTELLTFLRVLRTDEAVNFLKCCLKGRVRLTNGSSGELARIGRIFSERFKLNFFPLILEPIGEELLELKRAGSFICCCPNESKQQEGFDATFDSNFKTVSFRSNIKPQDSDVSIADGITNFDSDYQLISLLKNMKVINEEM